MRHGKIMSLGRPKKKRRFHGMSLFRATGISGTSVTGGLRGTAEPSCGLASGPHRGPKWRVWTTDRVRVKVTVAHLRCGMRRPFDIVMSSCGIRASLEYACKKQLSVVQWDKKSGGLVNTDASCCGLQQSCWLRFYSCI